jgi:tyrosyl-tRNA synthetase
MNFLLEDISWRGLLKDSTDLQQLSDRLDQGPITLYCGYDPTADSMHLGNLQMVLMLRRFQLAGHIVIPLSGGGTGLIGDPSGRTEERQLRDVRVISQWTALIKQQLIRLLPSNEGVPSPIFADNHDWIGGLLAVELLRDIGKHFTVNYMLAKDSVTSRLEGNDAGMSFTEFTYMILQSFDYLTLHQRYGCQMQIGGSDQWGNITAGISLIKKKTGTDVFGLTSPLILKSDGTKFGKSEGGALWLDRAKTSPFALYQYFLNIPDSDTVDLLKRLTLLSKDQIQEAEQEALKSPEKRGAQRLLASEVVRFVHGEDAVKEAVEITEWLFSGSALPAEKMDKIDQLLAGAPCHEEKIGASIAWDQLLVDAKIAPSKSEARRLIEGGGISAWDQKISDFKQKVPFGALIKSNIIIVSKGKRSKTVVRVIPNA